MSTHQDVAKSYPPRMRRGQVLELGQRLGLSLYTVRSMLDPDAPVIPRIIYPGTTRAYYDREAVCRALGNKPQLAS